MSTAFLQGRCQDRKLWVKLPSEALQLLGADHDTRTLLLKPCYGQIDAPRGWYLEAVDRLLRAGLRQHPLHPCAFLIYESDAQDYDAGAPIYEKVSTLGAERLCGMVIMHVDDMLGAGCKAVTDLLKENFSFREWKEEEPCLEYCGCQLEKTASGGRRLHQEQYMGKIKPISFSKGRPMSELLFDKEIAQVRGLLGSLQWPGVQTSPHLQRTTSMLSGQITKATVQTMHECIGLLKFAKENKDVSLSYNHLCHPDELQLVCFFDAGFTARCDGSSQGGYITMMVHRSLLTSSEEGEYHVLDWRSFRTPRVARSSLGAEAQAGGQAVDAVDFTRRYWHYLLRPNIKLKELLEVKSDLKPVLITDAKALYDSYHREGISSSVVNKRVSLEFRAMKERLEELSGSLRWMSSERQIADGLTRALLASRLRHGKLRMTWDPHYVAHKKKSKAEKAAAIAESTESTALPPLPRLVATRTEDMMEDEHPDDTNATPMKDIIPEVNETWPDEELPEENDLHDIVSFAQNHGSLEYVDARSHVVPSRMDFVDQSRMKNLFLGLLSFSLLAARSLMIPPPMTLEISG